MENIFETYGKKTTPVRLTIYDAENLLKRGYEYYCGEDYKYLDEYVEIANWLTDSKGKGLLLIGANGRGKSVFCTKILPAILASMRVKHILVPATKMNQYIRNNAELANIMLSDFLIIDDFGVEGVMNEYGEKRAVFSELIDDAEREGRVIVASTNLTVAEIEEKYGKRTLDRLHSLTTCVSFTGESMRR